MINMTEKRLTFTDLENWLFQTKKELVDNKDVDFDMENVTVNVNKIKANRVGKQVLIVKVNDKNYKNLVW